MAMEYVMLVAVLFVLALLVLIYFYLINILGGKDKPVRRFRRRRQADPERAAEPHPRSEEVKGPDGRSPD